MGCFLCGVAGTLLGGGGGVGVLVPGPGRMGEVVPARGETVGGADATEDAAEDEALGLASADMLKAWGSSFQPSFFERPSKYYGGCSTVVVFICWRALSLSL